MLESKKKIKTKVRKSVFLKHQDKISVLMYTKSNKQEAPNASANLKWTWILTYFVGVSKPQRR